MARHLHSKPLGELQYDAASLSRLVTALGNVRSHADSYLGTLDDDAPQRLAVLGVIDGCKDSTADLLSHLAAVREEIAGRQPTGERERVADYYDYVARTV